MKYFISHSSKDKIAVELFVDALLHSEPELTSHKSLFCSSIPESGSDYKEELITNINENISKAENIILIITENYMRSSYCFYEMSLARYLKTSDKKIILIVQNESIAYKIDDIFPSKSFLHINSATGNASNTLAKSLGHKETTAELYSKFFQVLCNATISPETPYIGMSRADYDFKYKFIEKFGVEKIGFDYPATPDIAQKKLCDAQEIYFVSTTGSGFLKTYKETLSNCVADGCRLSLVISDKNSDFSSDVAEIEAFDREKDYEQTKLNNELRIINEFQATFQYLNEIFAAANKKNAAGKIRCASSYTLIRQTVLIAKKKNGKFWGWITCTMPPVRSADQTPSVVFEADINNMLVNDVWKYATTIYSLAERKGGNFEIDGITVPEILDSLSVKKDSKELLNESKNYWTERYNTARAYMTSREGLFDDILIEVAAQHPLKNRTLPNKEFKARLDKAAELYNRYVESGNDVMIYVPGSRHQFNGIADEVSLSTAGIKYLLSKGIPEECLLGDHENKKYKGEHGVYNSADECYVSSEIFKNGQFEKLICICAPNQIMRKTMLYIEFGCIPLCFGVTTDKMHHENIVEEIFRSLNHVLYTDHSWQDENSEWFKYFRNSRKPADD